MSKLSNYFKKLFEVDEITRERRRRRAEFLKLSKKRMKISPYYSSDFDQKSNIDLITIAFNNPKIIDYQAKLIKKFIKGKYLYIVCDNSNIAERAKEIKDVCIKNDVTYIHATPFLSPNGYSDSHGIALNWVYKHVIKKRKNDFAFLDHDIFPIAEIEIENYLKGRDMFGVIHHRQNIWYLWPGFSFFRYDLLKNLHLNFRRHRLFNIFKLKYMDTGSGNWYPLYSKYDETKLAKIDNCVWDIVNNAPPIPDKDYGNSLGQQLLIEYKMQKTWLHSICGAEWTDVKGKNDLVYNLLNSYLGVSKS